MVYSRWSVKRASVSQLPVNIQNSLINTYQTLHQTTKKRMPIITEYFPSRNKSYGRWKMYIRVAIVNNMLQIYIGKRFMLYEMT